MTHAKPRSGGQVLVDQLKVHGVTRAYTVPGESFLAVLDAFYDVPAIELVVCRQEGGAAMMADAYGKLTGRPGICFVTRGPGATNASSGLHIAFQDSTPMVLFIGQVPRGVEEREAFQEVDYRRMFGQMAKWVAQIGSADRIPEFLSRAFHTATSGRPGPVVLALPEDVLRETVVVEDARMYSTPRANPGAEDMGRLHALLSASERPLLLVGGGDWSQRTREDITEFAERHALPVANSFRCQDYVDNLHSNYAGDLGLAAAPSVVDALASCDLLIALGARLGDITTGGYTRVQAPRARQGLVHVHPGAEELGRVYQPHLAIHAGTGPFAAMAKSMSSTGSDERRERTTRLHEAYLAHTAPTDGPGELQLARVLEWLGSTLPADAIITNGAGNYTAWLHRFYHYRGFRTQLAPTAGSMGYGLPAAIAAKHLYPQRTVVCFAGDGCFLMTGQELATAAQYRLNVIVVVLNNGMYGTIRMHQERSYPGRVVGTMLENPDFAAYARAFGAHGEVVTETTQFDPAFERAKNFNGPALLELRMDPEALTATATLSEVRRGS
jgi:acetolactate synthase-1/2/3 large subunit